MAGIFVAPPGDGGGHRTVDFENTVVIMTSNLGRGEADVMDAVRRHFRPEFINRIDEIIAFHPLDRVHMKRIIDIQLSGLTKRLEERKIRVVLTDGAKEQIVREGYDPAYGARPLKRTIQRRVLDALALRILEGEFIEGDTVVVDAGVDGLAFEKRSPIAA